MHTQGMEQIEAFNDCISKSLCAACQGIFKDPRWSPMLPYTRMYGDPENEHDLDGPDNHHIIVDRYTTHFYKGYHSTLPELLATVVQRCYICCVFWDSCNAETQRELHALPPSHSQLFICRMEVPWYNTGQKRLYISINPGCHHSILRLDLTVEFSLLRAEGMLHLRVISN